MEYITKLFEYENLEVLHFMSKYGYNFSEFENKEYEKVLKILNEDFNTIPGEFENILFSIFG